MSIGRTLLAVEDVSKHFDGIAAVDGATFAVDEGSITALIGPNGAGKSTLFNILSGFVRADRGSVLLSGRSIEDRAPHRIARYGLVRTFQLTKMFNSMTVMENMLVATPNHPGERLVRLLNPVTSTRRVEAAARAQASRLLEILDLGEHASSSASTLSGGQRKLLELGRALMLRPRLLLLDEPLAGVSPPLGRRLLHQIEQLRQTHGMTTLFVEHDVESVMRHSDVVVVMAEGRVIAQGSPAEVRGNRRVMTAYLGENKRAD